MVVPEGQRQLALKGTIPPRGMWLLMEVLAVRLLVAQGVLAAFLAGVLPGGTGLF